jgi:hypothetical protein
MMVVAATHALVDCALDVKLGVVVDAVFAALRCTQRSCGFGKKSRRRVEFPPFCRWSDGPTSCRDKAVGCPAKYVRNSVRYTLRTRGIRPSTLYLLYHSNNPPDAT